MSTKQFRPRGCRSASADFWALLLFAGFAAGAQAADAPAAIVASPRPVVIQPAAMTPPVPAAAPAAAQQTAKGGKAAKAGKQGKSVKAGTKQKAGKPAGKSKAQAKKR